MKTLPSALFPNCTFTAEEAAGFYDVIPQGYTRAVALYLSTDTVKDDDAIAKAAAFFDRVHEWDAFGKNAFLCAGEDAEDADMVAEYFDFYREEAPDVFDVEDVAALSLSDMVARLQLSGMGTHGSGVKQVFNVDFTLGYDQLLSVYFDGDSKFSHMAWES